MGSFFAVIFLAKENQPWGNIPPNSHVFLPKKKKGGIIYIPTKIQFKWPWTQKIVGFVTPYKEIIYINGFSNQSPTPNQMATLGMCFFPSFDVWIVFFPGPLRCDFFVSDRKSGLVVYIPTKFQFKMTLDPTKQ